MRLMSLAAAVAAPMMLALSAPAASADPHDGRGYGHGGIDHTRARIEFQILLGDWFPDHHRDRDRGNGHGAARDDRGHGGGRGGRRFVELGGGRVGDRFRRDVIHVESNRRFSQVRICAERRAIAFERARVVLRNGERIRVPMPEILRAGECVRFGDPDGPRRRIDRVVFRYAAARPGGRRPIVTVEGR